MYLHQYLLSINNVLSPVLKIARKKTTCLPLGISLPDTKHRHVSITRREGNMGTNYRRTSRRSSIGRRHGEDKGVTLKLGESKLVSIPMSADSQSSTFSTFYIKINTLE